MTTKRKRTTTKPPKPDTTLPRIFIKENQEVVFGNSLFVFHNTGGYMRLTQIGVIEPNATITTS